MIPAMIANSLARTRGPKQPLASPQSVPRRDVPIGVDPALRDRVNPATFAESEVMHDNYDEEKYLLRMVVLMCVVLVLPGLIGLVYLIFNPELFQYDITPQQDFSSWHPGISL